MTRYCPMLAALLLLAVLAPAVLAEEQPIELKPGPGQEETQSLFDLRACSVTRS